MLAFGSGWFAWFVSVFTCNDMQQQASGCHFFCLGLSPELHTLLLEFRRPSSAFFRAGCSTSSDVLVLWDGRLV